MSKRSLLTAYLAVWVAVTGGVIYGIVRAGYSAWVAAGSALLFFFFVNASLAYWARVRPLRLEGKDTPSFLQFLFFPRGLPKYKEPAPRSTHFLVGIAALLTGGFLTFCGVALAFDAEWSRIEHPILAASICMALVCVGVLFLYLAWRLLVFGTKARSHVA